MFILQLGCTNAYFYNYLLHPKAVIKITMYVRFQINVLKRRNNKLSTSNSKGRAVSRSWKTSIFRPQTM